MAKSFKCSVDGLDKRFASLRALARSGVIVSPNHLADLLNADELVRSSIVLIAHQNTSSGDAVLPSLSIVKPKNAKASVAATSRDLFNNRCIPKSQWARRLLEEIPQGNRHVTIAEIERLYSALGFSKHSFPRRNTTILCFPPNSVPPALLKNLASTAHSVRSASLQLINASRERTQRETLRISFHLDHARTLSSLRAFLRTQYDVHTAHYVLRYRRDDAPPKWHIEGSDSAPLSKIGALALQVAAPLFPKRLPLYLKSGRFHLLITPFSASDRKHRISSVLIVGSTSPLSKALAESVHYHISNYFSAFLPNEKLRLLGDMNAGALELVKGALRTIDKAHLDVWQAIHTRAEIILDSALYTTNAFSATVRLYDPFNRGLRLFAERGLGRNVSQKASDFIPLSDSLTSINVRTFLKASSRAREMLLLPDPGNYVPDLGKIRASLRKNSKEDVHVSYRPRSQSEYCVPLYYKQTKIGVLNFESPDRDGLRTDIPDLLRFRDALEQFITLALESSDKHWLAGRSQHYQNWHELSDIVDSAELPDELRARLKSYIETELTIGTVDSTRPLNAIQDAYEAYCINYKSIFSWDGLGSFDDELEQHLRESVTIRLTSPEVPVSRYNLDILNVIMKNLLDNLRKHGNPGRDKIQVLQRRLTVRNDSISEPSGMTSKVDEPASPSVEHHDLVEFRVTGRSMFDDQQLPSIFYSPLVNPKRKVDPATVTAGASYGLFIVGVLARQLGGFAWATNFECTSSHSMLIQVPI